MKPLKEIARKWTDKDGGGLGSPQNHVDFESRNQENSFSCDNQFGLVLALMSKVVPCQTSFFVFSIVVGFSRLA